MYHQLYPAPLIIHQTLVDETLCLLSTFHHGTKFLRVSADEPLFVIFMGGVFVLAVDEVLQKIFYFSIKILFTVSPDTAGILNLVTFHIKLRIGNGIGETCPVEIPDAEVLQLNAAVLFISMHLYQIMLMVKTVDHPVVALQTDHAVFVLTADTHTAHLHITQSGMGP